MPQRFIDIDFKRRSSVEGFVADKVAAWSPGADLRSRQVMQACAWANDQQTYVWHPDEDELIDAADVLDDLGSRCCVNLLKPNIEIITSRMDRTKPIWQAKAMDSGDLEDWHTARVQTRWLRHIWYAYDVSELQLLTDYWRLIDGAPIVRTWWDELAGRRQTITAESLVADARGLSETNRLALYRQFDELTGGHGRTQIEIGEGQLQMEVTHSLRMIRPNYREPLARQPWLIEQRRVSGQQLIDRYGNDIKRFLADNARDDTLLEFEQRFRRITDHDSKSVENDDETFLTEELWVPGTAARKNGVMAVILNGRLIDSGPNPCADLVDGYPHTEIPWEPQTDEQGGPSSPSVACVSLNAAFNTLWNRALYGAGLASLPRWYTTDSEIDEDDLGGPAGSIVRGSIPGQPPTQLFFNGPRGVVFEMLDRIESQVMQRFGAHQISHAGAPGGVRSGKALETLASMDELRLMGAAGYAASRWRRVAEKILRLAQTRMKRAERMTMGGDADSPEVGLVTGDVLCGGKPADQVRSRIIVVNMNRLSLTDEARTSRIERLTQMGYLNAQSDAAYVIRSDSSTATDEMAEALSEQHARAVRENLAFERLGDQEAAPLIQVLTMLAAGEPADPRIVAYLHRYVPRRHESSEVHLRVHNRARMRDVYNGRMTYLQRVAFDLHCEVHEVLAVRTPAHTQSLAQREAQLEQTRSLQSMLQTGQTQRMVQTQMVQQAIVQQAGALMARQAQVLGPPQPVAA